MNADIREIQRKADEITNAEQPPVITDTDMASAARVARHYWDRIRFTPERGFRVSAGRRLACDEKAVGVQALAKRTVLGIFDEIRDANASEQKELFKHARR